MVREIQKKYRTPYGIKSDYSGKTFTDVSLTSQEFAEANDIYRLLALHTSIPVSVNYGVEDSVEENYEYWQNKVAELQDCFYNLSVEERAKFGHSVEAFYKYMSDPNNYEDGVKRGIFEEELYERGTDGELYDFGEVPEEFKVGYVPPVKTDPISDK